jgi:hypothetical protein
MALDKAPEFILLKAIYNSALLKRRIQGTIRWLKKLMKRKKII